MTLDYSVAQGMIDKASADYTAEDPQHRPPWFDGEPAPCVIETGYRPIPVTLRLARYIVGEWSERREAVLKLERDHIYASATRRRHRQQSLDVLDELVTQLWQAAQGISSGDGYQSGVLAVGNLTKCRSKRCDMLVGHDAVFTHSGYCEACYADAAGLPNPNICSAPGCLNWTTERGLCPTHYAQSNAPTAKEGITP